MIGLEPDEHAYRRGLVLGWSLAEVFLLIVFALLFAFVALATKPASKTTGKPRMTLASPTASFSPGLPPNSFDDAFHKLKLCEDKNASLKAENGKLSEEIEKLKLEKERQKAEVAKPNAVLPQPKEVSRFPGGVDYPPCFASAGGRPDYIFDVTLGSAGIVIHKNDLPAHAGEEAQLPLGEITYDRELTDDSFIADTTALFNFSKAHECRFYARVCDQTKANEKDAYKQRLRVVESHFYKHEGCD
jgi:hypothetical protein